ncbi:MAG: ABC transporter permease [Bacteroidetes bacterium]|nr:ABC transporter permease [Bacteroidota bacterium]MBP6315282.1 ABC transporter permease [Chitinophagaceae bacterium]
MIVQFAWRYFAGKKSTQAIQIISWVSVAAMAVGTAALIVVLSVFNGFESTIKNLYSDYYPDMKVSATKGKNFEINKTILSQIQSIQGVEQISLSLEENVLLSSDENQAVVTLKGIDQNYDSVTHFLKTIQYGNLQLDSIQEMPSIVLGMGVSNKLGVSEESHFPVNAYAFKKNAQFSIDPTQIYNSRELVISALFVMPEIDNDFAFTSLQTVQHLAELEERYSSIEIKLSKNANTGEIQKNITDLVAPLQLKVANRFEQNKTLFFILKSERWAVYAILSMMLLIASFNIIGSLSMLVIEKEKDIAILKTLGMQNSTIKKIFLATGVLISLIGAVIGSILAWIICLIQIQFGIVKLGDNTSFVVENYPVKLSVIDFFLVMLTVVVIAMIASWIPAVKASKKKIELNVR